MRPSPFMGERHDIVGVHPGDPAPGAILTWTPPAKKIVQVIAVEFKLMTTVAAGNRHAVVFILGASVYIPRSPSTIAQIPNVTWTYYFTTGIAPVDETTDFQTLYQPLGCCYQLYDPMTLNVNADSMGGSDAFTDFYISYFVWDKG